MKVVLLTRRFHNEPYGGIYKYAYYLTKKLIDIEPTIEISVLFNNSITNFPRTLIYDLILVPSKLKNLNADIYHAVLPELSIAPIFLHKKPLITTIHDILLFHFPYERKCIAREYVKFSTKIALHSNIILTVSESSKNEICNFFRTPEEKVIVIPNGIDLSLFKRKEKEPENNIIGYLGGFGPRKNLFRLFKALKIVKKFIPDVILRIGGSGKVLSLINFARKLKVLNSIEWVGYVPERKLPKFYSSLKLFVYPSLYEGFGLPPLEAMACGTPVITSNISSLRETVGKGGILINPYDVDELAEAIYEILTNDKLRKNLIKKGLRRAKQFSWEKTAKETLKVYKEVLKHNM